MKKQNDQEKTQKSTCKMQIASGLCKLQVKLPENCTLRSADLKYFCTF